MKASIPMFALVRPPSNQLLVAAAQESSASFGQFQSCSNYISCICGYIVHTCDKASTMDKILEWFGVVKTCSAHWCFWFVTDSVIDLAL